MRRLKDFLWHVLQCLLLMNAVVSTSDYYSAHKYGWAFSWGIMTAFMLSIVLIQAARFARDEEETK